MVHLQPHCSWLQTSFSIFYFSLDPDLSFPNSLILLLSLSLSLPNLCFVLTPFSVSVHLSQIAVEGVEQWGSVWMGRGFDVWFWGSGSWVGDNDIWVLLAVCHGWEICSPCVVGEICSPWIVGFARHGFGYCCRGHGFVESMFEAWVWMGCGLWVLALVIGDCWVFGWF